MKSSPVRAGLHSEAKALVDVIVLLKCRRFIGIARSSMSFFIRELRVLHGLARETSTLLGSDLDERHVSSSMLFW